MIIFDFNNFIMKNYFILRKENINITQRVFLKTVLSSLSKYISNYMEDNDLSVLDKILLCLEGGSNWRKEIYPDYKFSRKLFKNEEEELESKQMYEKIRSLTDTLKKILPFPIVSIPNMEGDDIIGTYVLYKKVIQKDIHEENITIMSEDKDFHQLLRYNAVRQYSISKQCYLNVDKQTLENDLLEMICKGDHSDSIPNIFNEYTSKKLSLEERSDEYIRKTISGKFFNENIIDGKYEEFFKNDYIHKEKDKDGSFQETLIDLKKHFERNRNLIDLRKIPNNHKKTILSVLQNFSPNRSFESFKELILKEDLISNPNHVNFFKTEIPWKL